MVGVAQPWKMRGTNVHWSAQEMIYAWYDDSEVNAMVEEAVRRGWVYRASHTQAHWTEEGIAAFKKAKGEKVYRVYWVAQIPGKPFYVSVASVAEGVKIMNVLAAYDGHQFEQKVKPDYANTGGLEVFDPNDTEENPYGSWVNWFDEATGEDDPEAFLLQASPTHD